MAANKKGKISGQALILGGLALVLLVLVIIFFTGGAQEKVKRFVDANVPKTAETAAGQAATRTVTLFFIADGDDLLHKEMPEITAGPTEADEAERALAALIQGSEKGLV